jgi:hypothetical protein
LTLCMRVTIVHTYAVCNTRQPHEVDASMTVMVSDSHGGPAHPVTVADFPSIAKRISFKER